MTIKQQGGIFGRNPSFNDVTIDGDLTTSGTVTLPSDSVSGDAIDGGTATPSKIIMEGSGSMLELYRSGANANFGAIELNDTANSGINAKIGWNANTLRLEGTSVIDLVTNSTSALHISSTNVVSFKSTGGTAEMYFNGANLVMASGRGIDFSATSGTGTSELFSDYEEGSFTPAFVASGQSGSWTYTSQVGHYTKVGNRVFGTIQIAWSAKPSVGGQLWIYNLPFSVHADDLAHSGAYITYMTSGSMPNTNFLSVRTDNNHAGNPTGLEFYEAGTDTINASSGVADSRVGSSGNISLVFNYRVA